MYLCLLLIFDFFYLLLICIMLWLFAANKDVYITARDFRLRLASGGQLCRQTSLASGTADVRNSQRADDYHDFDIEMSPSSSSSLPYRLPFVDLRLFFCIRFLVLNVVLVSFRSLILCFRSIAKPVGCQLLSYVYCSINVGVTKRTMTSSSCCNSPMQLYIRT